MSHFLTRAALASAFLLATPFAAPLTAMAQESDAGRYTFTQDYEPSPALWRLADEDTTIYMFGTIHVLPQGFRWRSAQFDAVLAEADTLVLETSDYAEVEGAIDLDLSLIHI